MNDPINTPIDDELSAHKKRQHRLITLGVIIGLIALGAGAWWLAHQSTATQTNAAATAGGGGGRRRGGVATTVGVAVAEHADMPIMLEALGTVTPTATVTVIPQVSGTIARVLFQEGQLAKRGDVLATIDPRSFDNARMAAEGNLKRDDANLSSARLTLSRYQTLLKQDSIAEQDVDSQAATVKQLEGTVMADQAALNTAQLNLSYTNITAPVSGRVGLRTVDVGNYVAAGSTAGVALITVMDPIDVEFSIPQDQIPSIMKRVTTDKATLPATALDRTRVTMLAEGHFSTLDNRVDTTTGTVKAKAQFPNKEGALFPNQFVNVRILLDTLHDAVVVPAGAVRQGANGEFVYVLDPASSTVSMRTVKVGLTNGEKIVINRGLKVGETVITEGADRLKEGAAVKMPTEQAPAANAGNKTRRKGKRSAQQQSQ